MGNIKRLKRHYIKGGFDVATLPVGTEVFGREGEIKQALTPQGTALIPLSSWGVNDYIDLSNIKSEAIKHGFQGTADTAAGAVTNWLRNNIEERYLLASPPLMRDALGMAVATGPMVLGRRGVFASASCYDMKQAFLEGLSIPLPIPRTGYIATGKMAAAKVQRALGAPWRRERSFIACCKVRVPVLNQSDMPLNIGPLPSTMEYIQKIEVQRRASSIARRRVTATDTVTMKTYVPTWPVGEFYGVWTETMLRNAVEYQGAEIISVEWVYLCEMLPYLRKLYDKVNSIDHKPLRKAIYTRVWGKFVVSSWNNGIVMERGGNKYVAWHKNKVPKTNTAHKGKLWAPDKAAFILADSAREMVNEINLLPPGSFLMAHVDSIHTLDDPWVSDKFKKQVSGRAEILTGGTYRYYNERGRILKRGDMAGVSQGVVMTLSEKTELSRRWVDESQSYPIEQYDSSNLFSIDKGKYTPIANVPDPRQPDRYRTVGGWYIDGKPGQDTEE